MHGVARAGLSRDVRMLSKYPVYFHWEGSRVGQVYLVSGDSAWAQNVKMGVVSLLQMQREAGTRTEVSNIPGTTHQGAVLEWDNRGVHLMWRRLLYVRARM